MPIVKCKVCSTHYYAKPSWLKNGHGIYCSIKCRGFANRKGKVVKCFVCNKLVYKSLKDLRKSKSGKYFCNSNCSLFWLNSTHFGENNYNWKGGRFSYKNIMKRKGEKCICRLCGKTDQRIITVHHIDKNRLNNKPENLAWLCYNCHFLVHHYPDVKNKFLAKLWNRTQFAKLVRKSFMLGQLFWELVGVNIVQKNASISVLKPGSI